MQRKHTHKNAKIEISNTLDINNTLEEIKIIRRTIENNTHEVIEDTKIKKITSWRKSKYKFKKNLIFNILSFGILHIISLFYPKLYIKLYCNPWPAKESDFFLVENIYGIFTLCKIIHKKNKKSNSFDSDGMKEEGKSNNINIKPKYKDFIKNITYSFEYKYNLYEYDAIKNQISPIYLNLSKIMNKDIFDLFSDGLSSAKIVQILREKFGKNEYNLNIKLLFIYFIKTQIPSLAIVITIGLIEFINTNNYIIMQIKVYSSILIIVIQLIIIKIYFINKYKKEFSLDGQNSKVKVKRKYLLKDDNQSYYNLDNIDLLPGDIIFLKKNDYVPCDCIIIDGECIINESDLTGSLNISKKYELKNNSEYFNYKYSNINILYHGMKIVKSYSKANNSYISALCINIGSNTYKANQYSNTLYFLERKKKYNDVYNLFGERKKIFFYMGISAIFMGLIGIFYFYMFLGEYYINSSFLKKNIAHAIILALCKNFMAIFFIVQNIIIFYASYHLIKLDISCFDKSRLIKSGKINTILFNKTETLSSNELQIYGYHPVSFNPQKPFYPSFKHFLKSQSKELNKLLFIYYENYIKKLENKNQEKKNFKNENKYLFNNIYIKNESTLALFLECLFCCNNIEKYDMDFFGNKMEIEMFDDMKWDIKQDDENIKNYIKIKFFKDINNAKENKNQNNMKSNNHYYYIIRKTTDIFPKNYYKLTKSSNNLKKKILNNELEKNKLQNQYITRTNTINTVSTSSFIINQQEQIKLDISNSNNNSYKLRIYKKFITNDRFDSAAIVYNFLTKELRFMIKGYPEEIINRCDKNSLPENLEKIISINRKNGFIILVCASKELDKEEYNDNDELEDYLDELTFCGFITLENKLKDYVKTSMNELRKFNANFLIISSDNEYNCISTGFKSGIIDEKNVFLLDKENNNKITIQKIYSMKTKKNDNEENDKEKYTNNITKASGYDAYSRITTKMSQVRHPNNKINNNDNNDINISKNKQNNEDILSNELNEINLENFKEKRDKMEKRRKRNQMNEDLINGNSEVQRINKKYSNADEKLKSIINNTNDKLNKNNGTKARKKTKDSGETTNINEYQNKNKNEKKYLDFMEKYYYHEFFKDYTDIIDGIFCMSGKMFNFLYNNRQIKGVKNFLDIMMKKSKIFFNMTSIDKCLLVDYFRESPNNIVCTIGQCDSDVDSILSSDIGINLKNPKNLNTILCHYYSQKNDIICIKDIITIGKVFFENNILLESLSFIGTTTLDAYIICSLLRNITINDNEMNFVELEFLILSSLSFLGKPKENTYFDQNSKVLNIYYYVQMLEIMFMKLASFFLFCSIFTGDNLSSDYELDLEFLSYFFVIIIEFMICVIINLNLSSFFRDNFLSNYYLLIGSVIYFIYIVVLTLLSSSNYSSDIFSITHFVTTERIIDCYNDKNRLFLLISIIVDFVGNIIICSISRLIFSKFIK